MPCQVHGDREKRWRRLRLRRTVESVLQNKKWTKLLGLLKDVQLAAGVGQRSLLELPDELELVGGGLVGGGGQVQLGRGEEGGRGVGAGLGVVVLVVVRARRVHLAVQVVHLAVQLVLRASGWGGKRCKRGVGKSWRGGAEGRGVGGGGGVLSGGGGGLGGG